MDVLPLPDAEVVEVLAPAQPPERARTELLPLVPQVAPQVEEGDEVGVGVGEAPVVGGGRLLLAGRALPRILDRQRRREDEHLPDHAVAVGLDDHPGQPRIDRDAGQAAPELGEPHVVGGGSSALERAELLEQQDAVLDGPCVGSLDERERRDVARARARPSAG